MRAYEHTRTQMCTCSFSCPHTHSDTCCAVEKSTRMGSLACCRRGMSNAHLPTFPHTHRHILEREASACTLEASRNRVIKFSGLFPLALAAFFGMPKHARTETHTHTYTHASTQTQAHPSTPPLTHTLTRKQTKAKGDSTYLIPFKEPASGPPGQTCVRGHCHTVHSVSIYRNTHTGVGANEWYAHPPVWRRQHAASDSSLAGPRGRLERYEGVGNRSSVCWIFARADELCGSGDGRNESGAGQCLCGRGTPDHQRRTRGEEPRLKASDAA